MAGLDLPVASAGITSLELTARMVQAYQSVSGYFRVATPLYDQACNNHTNITELIGSITSISRPCAPYQM